MDSLDALSLTHGVQTTINEYAHLVDDGEYEALANLFMADGVLHIDRFDDDRPVVLSGREQIVRYLSASGAARASDPTRGPYRRHHVSSVLVTPSDGSRASARSYFLAVLQYGPDHWGEYEDSLQLDAGRWRFARRHVRVVGRKEGTRPRQIPWDPNP